jgi:hypothetical protein
MWATIAAHGETLYHFVDEHGVSHFSNFQLEPRYKRIGPIDAGLHGAGPGSVQAVEVLLSAPDQAVLGDQFEVTLSMPDPPLGNGYLEVTFDPEVLTLQAISTEASVPEPGLVRIELSLQAHRGEQVLASLSFQSIAQEPTQAALQVARVELVSPHGEPLPVYANAWATVRLVN